MADRKVSELNAATAGNLHDAALLHVVDLTEALAANQNVKMTMGQLGQVVGGVTPVAWTPAIVGSGGTRSITYTTQTGYYVRVGPLVFARYFITWSAYSFTASGSLGIGPLPFDTVSNMQATISPVLFTDNGLLMPATASRPMGIFYQPFSSSNSGAITLQNETGTVSLTDTTDTDLVRLNPSGGSLFGSFVYATGVIV